MRFATQIASIILSAALIVGCQTDRYYEIYGEGEITTLSVALSNSRTSLGDKINGVYPVYWTEGDCICVNGLKSQAVTIDAEDMARATFSVNGTLARPYSITYPYCESSVAKSPRVSFSAVQEYTEGSFDNGSAPMCGYANNDNITLKHLAGVLRFAIKGDGATALKSVKISSERALSGEFEVNCQEATITPTTSCGNSILYNLPNDFVLSSGYSYIHIAVPHGNLGHCTLVFTDSKGKSMTATWNSASVKAGIVREFKGFTYNPTSDKFALEPMVEVDYDGAWYTSDATVIGYVRCGDTPLAGVVVSDGLSCTTTDEKGFYMLKNSLENTKFIMASIPSGYTAPTDENGLPIFYHRVTYAESAANFCSVDFSFNKITNNPDRFTLIVGADPQPRAKTAASDRNAYHSLDCCEDLYRDMREKAATITDRNVYGLMLGDIVHENMSLYDNYVAGLKTLGFQMFNVLGNHDNDTKSKSDAEGRHVFEEKLGPTYYSFNIGKLHFVVLDNLIMTIRSSDGSLRDYDNGLTDEIWEWLKNDLSYIDRSSTIMVAAHSAMFKLIDGGNRGAAHKNDYGYLFAEFAKAHVWTGHQHSSYNYVYSSSSSWKSIEEHTVARSTGELWTNEYLVNGTPRGYTVVEVDGNNISWKFKPTIYQSGAFTATKYTSKKPNYTYRDWNYDSNGVAKMKADGTTLSEDYQMKVYKPGEYHNSYDDMVSGAATNNYVYVNVFLWDRLWEYPKYNGVEMEKLSYSDAYCLGSYEIKKHYYTYGYTLYEGSGSSYAPSNNNIHTIFRAPESRASGTGTVTVKDRFGNEYSQTVTW